MRIGLGWDAHRLEPGRELRLGGVPIPHDRGLAGHSDADVLAHAVADALLGALGEGDLGTLYPASDPRWEGASGRLLLAPILERVEKAGYQIQNVDTTLVAQEPRLAPYADEIREGLAALLGLPSQAVNVKLKSADHLGALGRSEGIAAHAVVLLINRES